MRILYLTGMYIGRYRVEVMVSQNNVNSKFLHWDRECAELIGQIADEVNRVKIEVCFVLSYTASYFMYYILFFWL